MRTGLHRIGIGLALAVVGSRCHSQQTYTYVTDFTKTDNIYTNLNEEFPHSGTGSPGLGSGTPNASFIFNPATYSSPNAVAGSNQTTNGVLFNIASDALGHDFAEVANLPSNTLNIPVNVANALSVSFLTNSYNTALANFTFTGTGGATESFNSVLIHDFNGQNAPNNYSSSFNGSPSPNFIDQTAFQVLNRGAGGTGNSTTGDYATYGMDEDTFILDSAFAGQTLTSISVTSFYNNSLVMGLTITSPLTDTTPEPGSLALATAGMISISGIIARRRRVLATRS